ENFDSTKITTLEQTTGSSPAGSCVNTTKSVFPHPQTEKGAQYGNNLPRSSGAIPLVTGSSAFNRLADQSQAYHSAACVSRYGIQDIVGNAFEANSERIFC